MPSDLDSSSQPAPARAAVRQCVPRLPSLAARVLSYLKREVEAYEVASWKRNMRYCGVEVQISPRCSILGLKGMSIGDYSVVNQFTHIFASGGIEIGKRVMISSNCSISSVTHPTDVRERIREPLIARSVRIEDDVWLGMGAVILPGVTIGHDAIVAAGAVVTSNVAPATIVAGNPARMLRGLGSLEQRT